MSEEFVLNSGDCAAKCIKKKHLCSKKVRAECVQERLSVLQPYQASFIQLAKDYDALKFGEFTLKSGRVSPYFFNAGVLCSGSALAQLGRCYADCIVASGLEFDILFGPAYKGIPLAAVTAAALFEHHGIDTPFAYNRKEKKAHGEGGQLVGAPLAGRVLIIDDVMTAGTAASEVIEMIVEAGASPVGIAIGLDRQEAVHGALSAGQSLSARYGLQVLSIVTFADLVAHLASDSRTTSDLRTAMADYRERYGAKQEAGDDS